MYVFVIYVGMYCMYMCMRIWTGVFACMHVCICDISGYVLHVHVYENIDCRFYRVV